MIIGKILVAIAGAFAWTGSLALWWLTRVRGPTQSPILRRYLGLKLAAWSTLMLLETLWYTNADALRWMHFEAYAELRQFIFRVLMAAATWLLIRDLLRPVIIPLTTTDEALVTIDEQCRILTWNMSATQLFGRTAEEMVGQDFAEELLPDSYRAVFREALQSLRQHGDGPLSDTHFTQPVLTVKGKVLTEIRLCNHASEAEGRFLVRLSSTPIVL